MEKGLSTEMKMHHNMCTSKNSEAVKVQKCQGGIKLLSS